MNMLPTALVSQITTTQHNEALLAGIAAALWLVIIALLHFIKPELKPSEHMVSEYARKPKGWIMQLAFFCMAIGCLFLVRTTWQHLPHFGLVLLAIAGVGFAGAGVFVTDPRLTPKESTTLSGNLHNTLAFIVILVFPIMATIVDINMALNAIWTSIHSWLPILSGLTWAGCIGFFWATAYSIGDQKRKNRITPVGYYQRFMILTYGLWLIVVAFAII
jgi:hypothetical protein